MTFSTRILTVRVKPESELPAKVSWRTKENYRACSAEREPGTVHRASLFVTLGTPLNWEILSLPSSTCAGSAPQKAQSIGLHCQLILCLSLLARLDSPSVYTTDRQATPAWAPQLCGGGTSLFNTLCVGQVSLAFEGMERPSKPGKLVWGWGRQMYVFLTNQANEDHPCCAIFGLVTALVQFY